MKQNTISLLVALLAGCAIPGVNRAPGAASDAQILRDVDAVDVVAVVELLEAQVEGNNPITDVGADVKTEVAIEKRVHTRGEIQLRGIVREFLKGRFPGNLVEGGTTSNLNSFNIPTLHLVSSRGGEILEVPGSNIPDLKIGEAYVVLFDPSNPSNLYFTSIWPLGSTEANLVAEHLKKERN